MATVKQLIDKNKNALDKHFYIESISLSYILIVKALKQIIREEKIGLQSSQAKLNTYIKVLRAHYHKTPMFKKKLKKNVYRQISEFCDNHKTIGKELKFQYPEVKLRNVAKSGMNIVIQLNNTLIKLRSNKL